MNDDNRDRRDDSYLWDGTGVPDPDVVGLEKTLGVLRHRGRPPRLPDRPAVVVEPAATRWRWGAAVLVLAAGAGWLALALRSPPGPSTAWRGRRPSAIAPWSRRGGSNRGSGSSPTTSRGRGSPSAASATSTSSRTRGSSSSRRDVSTMALDRGTIHARIWAPPKLFFVNTQAALAVDLGCAYTLQIDEQGAGLLRVTSGWVGLEREGATPSCLKAPCARCATMPGRERRATKTRPRATAKPHGPRFQRPGRSAPWRRARAGALDSAAA